MEIETIKLDATKQGRPIYEQFGFRREEEIVRWSRQNSGTEPLPVVRSSPPVWRQLDANYFGADRLSLARYASQNEILQPRVNSHMSSTDPAVRTPTWVRV